MRVAPPHSLLPPDAIAALQRAATAEHSVRDPLARQKAIEKATARIKLQYPDHFHQEPTP